MFKMQPELTTRRLRLLRVDGLVFKDHNNDGQLNPYEDWRLGAAERTLDLLGRMTLEERVGLMLHANPKVEGRSLLPGAGKRWDMVAIRGLILERHVRAMLNRLQGNPSELAAQANQVQEVAEESRLGIPLVISSDPRNHFSHVQGVSVEASGFTRWPDMAGFGAIDDVEVTREFADCVRREYRAVGIRMALSPMADLAVSPRWHRCSGTFGSDPEKVQAHVAAYINGLQHGACGLGPGSVAAIVKHWVGYGATPPDGFDAHNHYGRHLTITSETIEHHIHPFLGAFKTQVAGVMPAYGMPPEGLLVQGASGAIERVGMGFNRQMIHDVLRGRMGYRGMVLSDWHITDDCTATCIHGAAPGRMPGAEDIAMPWGVEHLSKRDRFVKAIHAGVDQFGGVDDPQSILEAVRLGLLSVAQIDLAAGRVLKVLFELGLFENPFVDERTSDDLVGSAAFQSKAALAQRHSIVSVKEGTAVPLLLQGTRVYLHQLDKEAAQAAGLAVVDLPEAAEVAIIGLTTPHEKLHPNHFFGSRYREGSTGWADASLDLQLLQTISKKVPVIACIYLERPADLSAITDHCSSIYLHFGLEQTVLFQSMCGKHPIVGRLPYDLPWPPTQTPEIGLVVKQGDGCIQPARQVI